ncbi:flagellar biosynthesis repressor FlbT [Bradyrhizobium erythrophlei]|uniref:Flagellar protein FlbT n=1 Tax=Bradyrhizobium erythrophlei TaxID=1437360 RepID=A0A1M5I6P8_9BRAD|nr:flagellar biosynthesis repressor FlbT [Bradyrhizobium erythrophlei]SHG24034.1 flagellar protein FlbT [Bradyrhizobium erythrophlei]
MPLRFDLGPFESLFIGKSVLTNHGDRTTFVLEGEIPILRAKDVLSPQSAATSLERLYCCVQQMYLEDDVEKYRGSYLALAVKALSENSNLHVDLQTADQMVKSGQFYRALKGLKKLIGANSSSVQMATARK